MTFSISFSLFNFVDSIKIDNARDCVIRLIFQDKSSIYFKSKCDSVSIPLIFPDKPSGFIFIYVFCDGSLREKQILKFVNFCDFQRSYFKKLNFLDIFDYNCGILDELFLYLSGLEVNYYKIKEYLNKSKNFYSKDELIKDLMLSYIIKGEFPNIYEYFLKKFEKNCYILYTDTLFLYNILKNRCILVPLLFLNINSYCFDKIKNRLLNQLRFSENIDEYSLYLFYKLLNSKNKEEFLFKLIKLYERTNNQKIKDYLVYFFEKNLYLCENDLSFNDILNYFCKKNESSVCIINYYNTSRFAFMNSCLEVVDKNYFRKYLKENSIESSFLGFIRKIFKKILSIIPIL